MEDTEATQSLLRSTRHLGVVDVKNARYAGLLAESAAKPDAAAEAMLFDTYNPWAALVQLNSTHPLTGRRMAVRFADGERLVGVSLTYDEARDGFFLFPADANSNNERVYILKNAVVAVERVA